MARVPVYRNRQVAIAPLPGGRRTPQQEGAGVGAAMADFGDTVARHGLAWADQLVRREQERADRTALTAAEAQLGELEYLLLDAPDRGVLHTAKGKDALTARDTVLGDFDTQADMIASNLTSDRQRDVFQQARDRRRLSMQEKVGAHVSRELDVYETGVAKAGINTAASLAVANAGNPARVAEELGRIETIADQYGHRLGLSSPEVKAAYLAEIRSKIHVGIIGRFLATDDVRSARDYFAEVRGQIQGDELAQIERALTVSNTKADAQAAFDRIEAQGGTFAEKRDKAKALTDPDVRDATLQYLEHEELVQERMERDGNEARSRAVYDVLDTGKGIRAIPANVWAQMSGPERSAARSYAKSLAEVGTAAAIKTDMGTLYELLTMSSVNEDAFLKTNLLSYRNKLSNADLEQMMRMQATMRGGGPSTGLFASEGIQNEVIDAGLSSMGLDLTPAELRKSGQAERVNQFRRAVREAVDREFPPSAGKKPTRADVQAIVDTLAAETSAASGGWFAREQAPRYAFEEAQAQVETVNQVPVSERRKIEAALRGRGIPISNERIVQLFNAQLSRVRKDR